MKKFLSVLLAILIFSAVPAYAADQSYYGCEELSDGSIAINIYTGAEEDIVLPTELYGYSITSVGSNAFKMHKTMRTVTVPSGYLTVSDYAFMNCSKLEELHLPDTLVTIGGSAFRACTSLKTLTLPGSVRTVGGGAFKGCSSLESVVIESGIETLSAAMFADCVSLANVTLPNTVKTIGGSAFSGCSSLTSITIPDSVETISDNAFDGAGQITIVCTPGSAAHEFAKNASLSVSLICSHRNTEIRGDFPATTENAGYTGDTWCLDCETRIKTGETIPPIETHLRGDANCNGVVNVADAVLVLKVIANWDVSYDPTACDVDGNGKIQIPDVIMVLKIIVS